MEIDGPRVSELVKCQLLAAKCDIRCRQSLRSDGDMLTEKMKAAGDDIKHKIYSGVTHEFIAPPSDPPFF
jgi:hypothetical protein